MVYGLNVPVHSKKFVFYESLSSLSHESGLVGLLTYEEVAITH